MLRTYSIRPLSESRCMQATSLYNYVRCKPFPLARESNVRETMATMCIKLLVVKPVNTTYGRYGKCLEQNGVKVLIFDVTFTFIWVV